VLGVIDPASLKLVASIPVGGHPESFRLEEKEPRIFVNVPDHREILRGGLPPAFDGDTHWARRAVE
jgi:hypothetical protein